jgi:hypothetical protein
MQHEGAKPRSFAHTGAHLAVHRVAFSNSSGCTTRRAKGVSRHDLRYSALAFGPACDLRYSALAFGPACDQRAGGVK